MNTPQKKIPKTDELLRMELSGHISDECRDILERRRDNEKEMENGSLYSKNFRGTCIRCGALIPKAWSWYKIHGNFCERCCEHSTHVIKGTLRRCPCNLCGNPNVVPKYRGIRRRNTFNNL